MSKLQVRLYFLYPLLLGVVHYFLNIFFPAIYEDVPLGQDLTLLFFYVFVFSGLIAFSVEKKNILAQIFLVGGSIIIFGLLVLISCGWRLDIVPVLKAILFSSVVHAFCSCFYLALYHIFEWIFGIEKQKEKTDYAEAE